MLQISCFFRFFAAKMLKMTIQQVFQPSSVMAGGMGKKAILLRQLLIKNYFLICHFYLIWKKTQSDISYFFGCSLIENFITRADIVYFNQLSGAEIWLKCFLNHFSGFFLLWKSFLGILLGLCSVNFYYINHLTINH